MSVMLLAVVLCASLLIVPVGLPGTWAMVVAGVAYDWLVPAAPVGGVAIAGSAVVALLAEVADIALAGRYTRRYGGSRRGAWGAIVGGIVGAVVGVPVPVVGPVIGALAGSFAGALAAEFSNGARHPEATRAATGAVIGRAAAIGVKAGAGCVIAAWLLAAAMW